MGRTARAEDLAVAWEPRSKPQAALLACPVFEIFYGGSRGSLKTDGMLGEWAVHADTHGKHAVGLMVRRERTQLMETIERAKAIYQPLGAQWHEVDKYFRFPNGARIRFAYLERDADAEAYQGHSYTRVYIEELTNFPDPKPVMKLMATLRSANGVRVGFRGTGNPGGAGHLWVKARYIDPTPMGWKVLTSEFKNPWTGNIIKRDRVFIPGKITDHNLLGDEYIAQLQMSGSPQLVRAWLLGDWSVIEGAYFPEFGQQHIIEPRTLPEHWTRFRAMDWGSAKPFSVGWYAISDGEIAEIPKGCIVKYREWYGMLPNANQPNTGLKLTADEVAEGIKERERGEKIAYGVLDPAAFAQDGGPSIAERMMGVGISFRRADNARVAAGGRMGGWDQLRARLKGDSDGPQILFFSTCVDTIRTLPALQHDENRPEDVETDGEDHAGDETRYACMSRPWVRTVEEPKPVTWPLEQPIADMLQRHLERRREARDD